MNSDNKIVMVFLVRNDVKMSKGRIASQVGHATQYLVEEGIQSKYITYTTWRKFHNSEKIVLKVNSEKELYKLHAKLIELSKKSHIPIKIVKDPEKTEVDENAPTVIGFGPINRNEVSDVINDLKLL